MKKETIQTAKTIVLALVVAATANLVSAAWISPPSNPPAANTDAPVNVGNLAQSKFGPLFVNTGTTGNIAAVGLSVWGNSSKPIRIVDSTPGDDAGKLLTSDANGYASWITPESITNATEEWDETSTKVYAASSAGVSTITMSPGDGSRYKFCALTYNRPVSTDDDDTNTSTRSPYCKVIREWQQIGPSSEPLPPLLPGMNTDDPRYAPNWKLQAHYSSCEAMCF